MRLVSGASVRGLCILLGRGVSDMFFVPEILLIFGVGGICASVFCELLDIEPGGIGALTARRATAFAGFIVVTADLSRIVVDLGFGSSTVFATVDLSLGTDTDWAEVVLDRVSIWVSDFDIVDFGFFLATFGAITSPAAAGPEASAFFFRGGTIAVSLGTSVDLPGSVDSFVFLFWAFSSLVVVSAGFSVSSLVVVFVGFSESTVTLFFDGGVATIPATV